VPTDSSAPVIVFLTALVEPFFEYTYGDRRLLAGYDIQSPGQNAAHHALEVLAPCAVWTEVALEGLLVTPTIELTTIPTVVVSELVSS
jgi:nucleotide-binding universal stress UspA family protein